MSDKKEYNKQYYQNNKERIKKTIKKWALDNKEKLREWRRQYYLNHRDKKITQSRQNYKENGKKRRLMALYNLSHKDWLIMWENQDGRCAICGKLFAKPSDASIDHNHKTGKIRGLICNNCNVGIGFFNDDPELLKKVIIYLTHILI